jgi:hypothetical protein
MTVIVIGWTAPGPEVFRVYAHLAFSHFAASESGCGTVGHTTLLAQKKILTNAVTSSSGAISFAIL